MIASADSTMRRRGRRSATAPPYSATSRYGTASARPMSPSVSGSRVRWKSA
jgi:hypothetical protein